MKKRGEIPEDLDTKTNAETPLTFPNGCHIAEVEIDPKTGELALVAYSAVDDCGRPLNTMIVEGQTHGSIAQGLGQAMMENAVYDASGGQLITGSFMDYAMPRADDMPAFKDAHSSRAGDHQSARRQGRGRSRHHRRDRRGHECHRRCHSRRRRRASRHAGDAGEDLAGLPEGGSTNSCRRVPGLHREPGSMGSYAATTDSMRGSSPRMTR